MCTWSYSKSKISHKVFQQASWVAEMWNYGFIHIGYGFDTIRRHLTFQIGVYWMTCFTLGTASNPYLPPEPQP